MLSSVTASCASAEPVCVSTGRWSDPAGGGAIARQELFTRLADKRIVLLGERHDSAEHHRWQLHTLAALNAVADGMSVGFEMFPRRVQPALDRWAAGELEERGFLDEADWETVWAFDESLYLPLFDFVRLHRLPMVALNVERTLVSRTREEGWANIPEADREGVSDPAPASDAYLETLLDTYAVHLERRKEHGEEPDAVAERDDPAFLRFTEAQLVWDRAMAEALAAAANAPARPIVVGIIGGGHLEHGYGVPHQLEALGIAEVAVLLPWDADRDCAELVPGIADAVFGLDAQAVAEGPPPPRLGVFIAATDGGVEVKRVFEGSVAEAADIREGDLIVEAAGSAIAMPGDLIAVVNRQAWGTWLPLQIERDGERLEIVARFPAGE
jgi:uncharacterized iron-regulated protein